jgi:hypothetical protein
LKCDQPEEFHSRNNHPGCPLSSFSVSAKLFQSSGN